MSSDDVILILTGLLVIGGLLFWVYRGVMTAKLTVSQEVVKDEKIVADNHALSDADLDAKLKRAISGSTKP